MSWVFMYMSKRRLIIGISGKYGCLFDEDLGVVRYHENRWSLLRREQIRLRGVAGVPVRLAVR